MGLLSPLTSLASPPQLGGATRAPTLGFTAQTSAHPPKRAEGGLLAAFPPPPRTNQQEAVIPQLRAKRAGEDKQWRAGASSNSYLGSLLRLLVNCELNHCR
ncbi:hypothetical protein JEQ12_004959 [Ovis aries]|uniref:Uncharacterized protein n=1 Tax=Ovis aries TaxID=9940 RepID=A0A836CWR3_SHEEP|nr:hypothetical protein JEQ12_004959 [Ovis aries]